MIKAIPILLIFLLASCGKPARDKTALPNIILILADDLGWSDIACYGSEVCTPNLDKLAEDGIRFTNFHNTSKCFPSRACLLTGLYAQQTGYARNYDHPLMNSVTLGEVLQQAGYRTLWSGKHHGSENPVTRGFDRYYGLKDGATNYFNPGKQRPGEGKPAQKRNDRQWCIDSIQYSPYTPEEKDFYTTDYFTNYALTWLEEYKEEDKPYFLYLSYNAPHDPLQAWQEDIEKYRGKYMSGYEEIRKARFARQIEMGLLDSTYKLNEPIYSSWQDYPDSVKSREDLKMAVYAAMIDRMDWNIGRILEKVKELGEEENTFILFMSDNGASAEVVNLPGSGPIGSMTRWTSLGPDWANVGNTPFRYYKNFSYEGGIRTPLIIKWPGHILNPGSFNTSPGHFIDIMATFVELTGVAYPDSARGDFVYPLEGQSLLSALNGDEIVRESPLFWQWQQGSAMLYENWKIVKHGPDVPWDLYNLSADPTEYNNVASVYPQVIEELDSIYNDWLKKYKW